MAVADASHVEVDLLVTPSSEIEAAGFCSALVAVTTVGGKYEPAPFHEAAKLIAHGLSAWVTAAVDPPSSSPEHDRVTAANAPHAKS